MNEKNCVICGKKIKMRTKDDFPTCRKKKCIKEFTRIFGLFCRNIDKELGIDTDGFLMNKQLIRFNNFNEDFERVWKEKFAKDYKKVKAE